MSEVRLIDANALKEDLKQYFPDEVLDGVSARSIFNQILHDIDNAPTVNPESCRECPFVTDEEKQITKERPQCDLDREIELYKSKVAFYESQNTRGEYNVTVRELKYVIEILEALRSERPQGEWKLISMGLTNKYQCSLCGRTISPMYSPMLLSDYPFCHCGAKMKMKDGKEE